jgi:hypothetical protein
MTDRENPSQQETRKTDKEQVRHKTYLARELENERTQKARVTKQNENRTQEENKEKVKEQARKADYLAREKATAEAHELRKTREAKK